MRHCRGLGRRRACLRHLPPRVEVIRDEDVYSGVRIGLVAHLATARLTFHVDVNIGDPIWPPPEPVGVSRLLGGVIEAIGYPLTMIHAEKLVTALQRGTANTRWRISSM